MKIVFVNSINQHIFTFFNNHSEHNIRKIKLYTILTMIEHVNNRKKAIIVYNIQYYQCTHIYSYWLDE